MKKMPLLFYGGLFLFTLYSIYLSFVSVLLGEVNFFNDVARDFLLLQELDIKKLVFIGPRTNTSGLFHGPLWTYVNYPSYLLGHGDPVFQAWFWVVLVVIFLLTCYFITKKLFGTLPALAYVLLLATRLIPHINGVFHSEATFFVIPVFFFTILAYAQTKKVKNLIFHFIAASFLIELNIGDGIPFLILSALLTCYLVFRNKQWKHLLSFFVVPLFLLNFILFDIKHSFTMIKALFSTSGGLKFFIPVSSWIQNRIDNTVSLQLIDKPDESRLFLLLIFAVVLICSVLVIRADKKQKPVYLLFLFYYLGYMALTFFNKGVLLYHYTYLLIPLTYLWLVSFLRGKYKPVFIILIFMVYLINLLYALDYIAFLKAGFIGKHPNSWKGLSAVATEVVKEAKGREFGYFVFSPDAFAYQPRYAMIYNFKASRAKASEYVKKDLTYVIAQPPPANDKYMDYKWWVRVPVGITVKPVSQKTLPNGYVVLEYHLTPKEQKIPHDKAIELDIHFR